jgi:glycosyltransferase involved in cell wall biosynthesis
MVDELTEGYGLSRERIAILPNALDETALRAKAVSPQRQPGPGRRFVCVGRLIEQKGYDRLIADFARLPDDSRLTIFGEGEKRAALAAQIARLHLSDRVTLAGFELQPMTWVAGADALLLSSRWEGMPNAALEALACGTPVIATPEAGGITDVAAQAQHGAVTLATSGTVFVAAMLRVEPRRELSLRASLLPDIYQPTRVAAAFAELLIA